MPDFIVHDIDPGVEIRVTRLMPALPRSLDHAIEALWTAAARRVEAGGAGRLFNGQVFSIDAISPSLITGHMTEYRRVIPTVRTDDSSIISDRWYARWVGGRRRAKPTRIPTAVGPSKMGQH